MNPEPNAALIDAGAVVAALFLARLVALRLGGGQGWTGWIARWLRRGVAAALLVPALRLVALAMQSGDRAPLLVAAAIAILAAGGMLALLDDLLVGSIRARHIR